MARSGSEEITGYRNDGVGAAVALINAVTADGDDSAELLRKLLSGFNFLVPEPLTPRQAGQLREWARRLRPVFAGAEGRVVDALNELMAEVAIQPHISDHGLGPHLHYGRPGAGLVDRVRANTLMGLAFVVCDLGSARLGVCAAEGCDRVYADIARGPRRQFCSKTCLNRSTVAAFRARRART
ncbi:CGNR zinc finger domain-containing protein [Nocardia transvalensis]|uniref:CGNR zinc finger domain-containing protein n=1 Tax=Nocardia transvalensis TaxID=37333 RepID=UPI0018958702|nr:CGNR zinc finger domain-containing protein [Nocardia transvalensis]MBF6331279.1 CGNR zinc finger domain-containing protein [Nocardia transvalensis]